MPKGIRKDGTKLGFQLGHKKIGGGWVLKERYCEGCGQLFLPTQPNQRYCGSKTAKTGCSYQRHLINKVKWSFTDESKEYHRQYDLEWQRKQREGKTDYFFRQKRYRDVDGMFTYQEWMDKLEQYNHRCAKCGVHESQLPSLYKFHQKLTIEHIVPVSKGGTNYISNIVPLCIGCNSRKRDRFPIVGYVGATMDTPHDGHVKLLERAKQFCDYLIVALNTDEFVEEFKHKRPLLSLEQRRKVIGSFWMVDEIVENFSGADSKPVLLKYDPDIIFVGDDYNFESYCKQMDFTREWLAEHKMAVMILPRTPDISSTEIKERMKNA